MKTENWTLVSEFILVGLSEDPALQLPLFMFFLLVYIITLVGNVGIITLVRANRHLHTPMYFLLCNLSFIDICVSTITVPNMLSNLILQKKTISVCGCETQMFLIFAIGSTEVFLFPVMAYDRYTAICNPLLYPVIMSNRACISLIGFIFLLAIINSLIQTTFTFMLPFCRSNRISHFFCDVPALLKLSCSDTTLNEVVLVLVAGGLIAASVVIVIISYTYIVLTILKITSSADQWKAISTCSAHFVCVALLYGTLAFIYAKFPSSYSLTRDKVVSVFNAVAIPMLNPFIYSLRNQEVKQALRKAIGRK
ncbi:olfactory receptor 5AP2-like [Lissotriton helveticus]